MYFHFITRIASSHACNIVTENRLGVYTPLSLLLKQLLSANKTSINTKEIKGKRGDRIKEKEKKIPGPGSSRRQRRLSKVQSKCISVMFPTRLRGYLLGKNTFVARPDYVFRPCAASVLPCGVLPQNLWSFKAGHVRVIIGDLHYYSPRFQGRYPHQNSRGNYAGPT